MFNMNDAYQEATQDTANAMANSKPVPAGDYPIIIDNIEYKQFNSGSWGFNLQASIVGGGTYDGRKLFDTFIIFEQDGHTEMLRQDKRSGTMKNFGKLGYAKLCQSLALSPEQAGDAENIANHVCGKMVTAKTKIGENSDGQPDAKISYYKPMAEASQQGGFGSQAAPASSQPSQGGFGQQAQGAFAKSGNSFQRN